ncbi:hypothetical protein ACA910_018784 [Epithemia clementina (nom. ined.)]
MCNDKGAFSKDNDRKPIAKDFIPYLETKILAVATPAKCMTLSQAISAFSPLALVLKPVGAQDSEGIARASIQYNFEQLQLSQEALSAKLNSMQQTSSLQVQVINNLLDKINILAGLVGVPTPEVEVPTLW